MFRFDHIHLVCRDLAAVGTFLTDILGAEELRRTETESLKNWEYSIDGVRVFVRQQRTGELLAEANIRREGVDHLGLRVAEIGSACKHLIAAGCILHEGPSLVRHNLKTAFLMAPGGLLLELLQRD